MPRLRPARSPGQVIALGFAGAVLAGTALLMMPVARAGPESASPVVALFTATSAVCVTGLSVVDTAGYWSPFGEVVLLALVQLGGLGIMTVASLLGILVSRRLGLRSRITTAAESNQVGFGDLRRVLLGVAGVSLAVEAAVAVALAARFWLGYDEAPAHAAWLGAFHSVMAFNHAGFALFPDSLTGFAADPLICLPVALAVILGSLGFPVLFELRRELGRPRTWSLHTKLTVLGTAMLLLVGSVMVTAAEWDNPGTLGALDPGGRLLAGFFQGVMPRSAGFNSVDYGEMREATLLGTDALMFVGGGSAGTAGGIKVTTFLVLLAVILAEARGDRDVNVFGRRLGQGTLRQALSLTLVSLLVVVASTFTLTLLDDAPVGPALFEVVSAFSTTGLSTGLTAELSSGGQLLLTVLMFIGRLGPITFASALALREKPQLYAYPEGRPIIG